MGFDPATLKYNDQGLIPAIAQDEAGDVVGEADHVREAFHEAFEIRNDCPHLRLLQHDLGDPDTIGITVLLPLGM